MRGGVGGRDVRVGANSVHVAGNDSGVCPHVKGGIPKGSSGRQRQSEREGGRKDMKNINATYHRWPKDLFIILFFFVGMDFYYLV